MHRRSLLAFLLAPLAPGIVAAFGLGLMGILWSARHGPSHLLSVAGGALLNGSELGAILGYPMALLLGVPIHWLLSKYHRQGPLSYGALGGVLGAISWLPLYLATGGNAASGLANSGLVKLLAACGAFA